MNNSQLDSEELYCNLRKKLKDNEENLSEYKSNIEFIYSFTKEEIYKSKKFISLDYENISEWKQAKFKTEFDEKSNINPVISSEFTQKNITKLRNGIELTNIIYSSNESINYKIVNNKIKSSFLLKAESDLWIFLHVKNDSFDDNTIVILFSKEEFYGQVNMSLGTFIPTPSGKNLFTLKIFQTLQLVKTYYQEKISEYNNNIDTSLVKILISDEGDGSVKVSAWINGGDAENVLRGNFFKQIEMLDKDALRASSSSLEMNNDYKIMIAGNGNGCKLNYFIAETNYKEIFENFEGINAKSNDYNCCYIF